VGICGFGVSLFGLALITKCIISGNDSFFLDLLDFSEKSRREGGFTQETLDNLFYSKDFRTSMSQRFKIANGFLLILTVFGAGSAYMGYKGWTYQSPPLVTHPVPELPSCEAGRP